ncbi:MAG: phosphate ABC transporter ATP-binding protein [Anaerolineae bacterium]|nr:phosphate ABC transporter ATP-binding protein [Anaerolineae bacterium]
MESRVIYQLSGITKIYQDRRVLDIESLDIYRGEILALVGPSGAGKSTLLRLLNFVESPTAGCIRFLDADLDGGAVPLALRRRVTTVFQRPILLDRSVEANVRYGLRLRGQSNGGRQVSDALNQVGMIGLARQRARTLSGGEMQRVSLARAMVLQPDVLLLDEPTANLDPYNVGLIEEIIGTLNRERGTTLVLVTHNVFQARRLAHRAGLLLDGRLIEVDEREHFFEQPQDTRTAAFVRGEMVY